MRGRSGAGPLHLPVAQVPDERTTGAGDTFAAALTVSLAAGAPLRTAARIACAASAVAVSRPGTSVCTLADLHARLAGHVATADPERLAGLVAAHRADGKRIVFTNGCFDVLHRGHVAYLEAAAKLGDVLVVAVNSDASVRRQKGPDRPINGVEDRLAVLRALTCVDHLAVFDGDTPTQLIGMIRPDVYVKGGDYTESMLPEAPLVRALGGEVRIVGYVEDRSTSAMVRRIRYGAGTAPA
jgi:rfaE bifunctional protein nucleotidyltransferase chain/domain